MPNSSPKIIKVIWLDAMSRTRWEERSEAIKFAKEIILFESIGFLVDDNKDYIVIAQCRDVADGDITNIQKIPKGCVKKIIHIK